MSYNEKKFLFIVGTAKAGTTSLANWLGQREDMVLGTEKEPKYFGNFRDQAWQGPAVDNFVNTIPRSFDQYLGNYAHKPSATWLIDASVDYLWSEAARDAIIEFSKNVPCKVVCVVRDPIDRAISEYSMTRRMLIEEASFTRSLELEDFRRRNLWHPLFYHVRRSQIADDIRLYMEKLGDDFLVVDYASLGSPEDMMEKISLFVGSDEPYSSLEKFEIRNTSVRSRSPILDFFDSRKNLKNIIRRALPRHVRAPMRAAFDNYGPKNPTVLEHEISIARDLLQAEIARCISCPYIPTDNWRLSIQV